MLNEEVRNKMSGLWEQIGETENLEAFLKAQGKEFYLTF